MRAPILSRLLGAIMFAPRYARPMIRSCLFGAIKFDPPYAQAARRHGLLEAVFDPRYTRALLLGRLREEIISILRRTRTTIRGRPLWVEIFQLFSARAVMRIRLPWGGNIRVPKRASSDTKPLPRRNNFRPTIRATDDTVPPLWGGGAQTIIRAIFDTGAPPWCVLIFDS